MKLILKILLFLPLISNAQSNEPININNADFLDFNKNYANAQRLVGNVSMSQGNLTLNCDSAWFWKEYNRLEAFGKAYLTQSGGIRVWSDIMLYDGNLKTASATSNVKMTDGKMTLTTDNVQYDVNSKTAFYSNWANITDGKNNMISRKGSYHTQTREYFFKDKIILVNPEYKITCDTLNYNGNTKTTYFFGPTFIKSEDNLLFCNYGWYNTEKNTCFFSKKAYIQSRENRIDSDSFSYNRNTGIGKATGNILLTDSVQNLKITGNKGTHSRFSKTTLISGNSRATKINAQDTLIIDAEFFYDQTDTSTQKRNLAAFGNTKVFKSDIQAISDSLNYSISDSLIKLFKNPVLWNENNQTSGDTIIIEQKNNKIDKMIVLQESFVIMQEAPQKYNQIKGKNLTALFSNNKLFKVIVVGNGQSLYYVKKDSAKYSGINYVESTEIEISTDSSKVKKVKFIKTPTGTYYPSDKLPPEKEKLKGFNWMPQKRPKRY